MTLLAAELTPEMEAIKAKQKATWMSGDYGHFATYLEPGALEFFSRISIEPGMRILDVACGAGQISIPAARAGAKVTGIDIATNLVEQARARARAENLDARRAEFARRLVSMTGCDLPAAESEVDLSVGRLFTYAAWADKYGGAVQETTLRGITVGINEPVGVIGIACPDEAPLLAFVSLMAPAIAVSRATFSLMDHSAYMPVLLALLTSVSEISLEGVPG